MCSAIVRLKTTYKKTFKNFLCQLWHVIIFISPLYFQSVFFLEILSFQKSKVISDFCYHFEQSWSEAYYKVYCLTS